jgi:hypothetical protein
VKKVKQEPLEK